MLLNRRAPGSALIYHNDDIWRLIALRLPPRGLLCLIGAHPRFRRLFAAQPDNNNEDEEGWWRLYFLSAAVVGGFCHGGPRALCSLLSTRCQACGARCGHRLLAPFALRLCAQCLDDGLVSNRDLELVYGVRSCTGLMAHALAHGGLVLPLRTLRMPARRAIAPRLLSSSSCHHNHAGRRRRRGGGGEHKDGDNLILFYFFPSARAFWAQQRQQQERRRAAAALLTAQCRRLVDSHVFAVGHPPATGSSSDNNKRAMSMVIMLVHSPPHFVSVAPHVARALFVIRRQHHQQTATLRPDARWIPCSPFHCVSGAAASDADARAFQGCLAKATRRIDGAGVASRAWLPPRGTRG